jgi:hypothetical protein
MPFPTGAEDVSNRELMKRFLDAVRELLGQALREGRDPKGNPLFYEELLPLLRDGWGGLDGHVERLKAAVDRIPDDRIEDHALDGAEFLMKIRVVRFFADRFQALGGIGPFRRLLETLEGLLDSIIDAAGTGGAIKEFKEFVRNSTAG